MNNVIPDQKVVKMGVAFGKKLFVEFALISVKVIDLDSCGAQKSGQGSQGSTLKLHK